MGGCDYRTPPSEPFEASEVPGTYEANYYPGVELLTLREDGVFEYYLQFTHGDVYRDTGTWSLDSINDNQPVVTLRTFVYPLPRHGRTYNETTGDVDLRDAVCSFHIRKDKGQLMIVRDWLRHQFYMKVD